MTETSHLIELNLEIEGMLRILDNRQNAEALNRLEACFNEFSLELKRYIAGRNESSAVAMPESDKSQQASEPAAVYFELDTPAERRDLAEVFTDAERDRFCSGLFEGNEADFEDTVGLLSDMASYSEAEDYLINDMMWNRQDAAVADFLAILSKNMPE